MKTKLMGGLLISALLVYLSVRGIDVPAVAKGLTRVTYGYAVLFLIIVLGIQVLRSIRWGLILRPLVKIDQLSLFSVSSVGFLAITAIPARLGELARPYLITQRGPITMTAAVGTIFAERILDSMAVLLIAVMTPLFIPLPSWLIKASTVFFWLTIILAAAALFLVKRRDLVLKAINPFFCRLAGKHSLLPERLLHQFSDGFKIITDIRLLVSVGLLTVAIWLIDVLAVYIMFLAFGLNLPVAAAIVVMIVLVIGIAIPTAPGYVGNWHFFCILGLGIFGIPKTEALSFAIVYHVLSLSIVIIPGLLFLPFNRFSLSSLKTRMDTPCNGVAET